MSLSEHGILRVFIDTEFTTLDDAAPLTGARPGLISIALVTDCGQALYLEVTDFAREECSEFVLSTVIPLLGLHPTCCYPTFSIPAIVEKWLFQFDEREVEICFDNDIDWVMLSNILSDDPPIWISKRNIVAEIDRDARSQFFIDNDMPAHHALHDALANRHSFNLRIDTRA